jgi:hypothetical protein
LQVHIDLGSTDHVWQEKRAAFAATVDTLGDMFKTKLHAGWLAYISETFPDGEAAAAASVGVDTLMIND